MDVCDEIIIGQSPAVQKARELIRQVAGSDLNVIICGESGVGKEVVAQSLHLSSSRRNKPFIKVNCAAIPSELLESELFGYEKGAFTGADRPKMGKFEMANEGTILLDEIGDMPPFLQSKMLQVLQDFQFSRLGAKTDVRVDCWVLAATNHDLEQDVREGLFREDLYYRLNIIRIFIPPLRERRGDIDLLINHFSKRFEEKIDQPAFRFDENALRFLRDYSWPGNIRELKNTVERLLLLGDWSTVKDEMITREIRPTKDAPQAPQQAIRQSSPVNDVAEPLTDKKKFPALKDIKKKAIQEAEGKLITQVLNETDWNRKRAAEILQISYKALLYKIKELELREQEQG